MTDEPDEILSDKMYKKYMILINSDTLQIAKEMKNVKLLEQINHAKLCLDKHKVASMLLKEKKHLDDSINRDKMLNLRINIEKIIEGITLYLGIDINNTSFVKEIRKKIADFNYSQNDIYGRAMRENELLKYFNLIYKDNYEYIKEWKVKLIATENPDAINIANLLP